MLFVSPCAGLLDRKWIEERNRAIQEKSEQEEVYARGLSKKSSLEHLADRRTDIFGAGTAEAGIGKKVSHGFIVSRYLLNPDNPPRVCRILSKLCRSGSDGTKHTIRSRSTQVGSLTYVFKIYVYLLQ